MLGEVEQRIRDLDIHVSFDPSVAALLAKEGFDPAYGARPLRRAVVRLVEDAFSTEMLEGRIKAADRIRVLAQDGKIIFMHE